MCPRLMITFLGLSAALAMQAPAAAQELCANPAKTCSENLSPDCLGRVGAGSLAAGVTPSDAVTACGDEFNAYRACLSRAAQECTAARPPAVAATPPAPASSDDATMLAIWNEIKNSGDVATLESFAEAYDGRPLAALARSKAASLRAGGGHNAAPAPEAGAGADTAAQAEALELAGRKLGEKLNEKAQAMEGAEADAMVQAAALEADEVLKTFSACSDATGDRASEAVVERVLLDGPQDARAAKKLNNPATFDDELLSHVLKAGQGEEACVAAMIEDLSRISPEMLMGVSETFEEYETLLLTATEDRPKVGEVNTEAQNLLANAQNNLVGALAVMNLRLRLGVDVPQDTRIALEDSIEAWGDTREELVDALPDHLQDLAPRIVRCHWAGEAMRCAY